MKRSERQEKPEPGFAEVPVELSDKAAEVLEVALTPGEKELLRELIQSLRTIRYGSIVLVIHDGRLVEVNKTVRIRRGRAAQNERHEREE